MIEKFHIQLMPQGYQSKIADDIAGNLLSNSYLAPGTQNVLIGDDGCVQSRKGYELLGQAGGYGSVVWSDTWRTWTNQERAMRTIFDTFQVYYNGQWRDVKSWFGNNTNFCGNSWFDKTESMSKYIFVNGTTKIYSWQGGIAEVASRVSGSSLKKTNGATPTLKQILIPAGWASISWGYPTVAQNEVTINAIKWQDVPHNFWDEF